MKSMSVYIKQMKFIAATFLSLLASATAFCPNLCNGHGKCGNQDRCVCYTYAGTTRGDFLNQYDIGDQRAAWTGADCSLRTCPLAFSWSGANPSGLSKDGLAITIMGVNSFRVSITGSLGAMASPAVKYDLSTNYKNFATGSKMRLYKATGVSSVFTIQSVSYTWASGAGPYTGTLTVNTVEDIDTPTAFADGDFAAFEDYDVETDYSVFTYHADTNDYGQWDANGAHGLLECAGQGICDRGTGQCNCFPGYEGEACTRTSCPNSCSGHGVCLELYRLAADFGTKYDRAWDSRKHFGCKCDVGFRGPDCSLQECPSDYDPLNGCGGGRCNTGGYYTDKAGVEHACPNAAIYSTTVKNVVFNINTSDCYSGEQRDCSGRGICDYDTGVCQCFSGFFGESCNIQTVLV